MLMNFKKLFIAILTGLIITHLSFATNPTTLQQIGYINDYTQTLTATQQQSLSQLSTVIEQKTGVQLATVIIPQMGENWTIEEYTNQLFESWGIGQKEHDNGLLLLVTLKEKMMRIEVGYGLEGAISDLRAKEILNQIENIKLDKGTKNFQPSNLEIVNINTDNTADNVIPAEVRATFNIRFNNKHSSKSLKKKLNKIIKKICKKNKCSFKISYMVSGEAFITNPDKTTFMIQKIIKKITKIKTKLSTTGGISDARFIRKISPCVEFGLVGKTMHKIDESVALTDLKKLTQIYKEILENYFK